MKKDSCVVVRDHDSPIMRNSVPEKMLVACFFSCVAGIVLMAFLSHYLLMAVLIGIILCLCITTPLFVKGKISINTACLVPILLVGFLYIPASWMTFDGLLGCTPYLSILFITVITLTHYRKTQKVILCLHAALMVGLTAHWLGTRTGTRSTEHIVNNLVAYALTAILVYSLIESVKRRNSALNERVTKLSKQDDLTGLLNRRAIEDTMDQLESDYDDTGAEYAVVMLDVDKFKGINDVYGHHLGDLILKSLGASISETISPKDYAFRYGGDEFLLLLPHADREDAEAVSARIADDLQKMPGCSIPLTVSYGCALRSESPSASETVVLADQRMYENKRRPPDART